MAVGGADEVSVLVRGLARDVAVLSGRIASLQVASRDGWQVCTCPDLRHPPFCAIMAVEPGADAALTAALPEAVEEFDRRGLPPNVLLADRSFPRTEHAALALGLAERERVPGMVVRPNEFRVPPPVDADLRRIGAGAADRRRLAGVAMAGLGIPAAEAELITTRRAVETEGAAYHLAETADGPAACAITHTSPGGLGIYLVGTVPEQRRRGLAAALVGRAVADAFADGTQIAYLQTSEMGHSVYRRLGFREVSHELRLRRPSGAPDPRT